MLHSLQCHNFLIFEILCRAEGLRALRVRPADTPSGSSIIPVLVLMSRSLTRDESWEPKCSLLPVLGHQTSLSSQTRPTDFLCRGPENKHFQLWGILDLYHLYPALLLWHKSSHRHAETNGHGCSYFSTFYEWTNSNFV